MSEENYKIDYTEDKEIRKMAAKKIFFNDVYLVAAFLICIGICIGYIIINSLNIKEDSIIITKKSNNLVSIKNAYIDENITNKVFNRNDKYIIEKVASIEYNDFNIIKDNYVKYNLKLNILKNDFPYNVISSTDSHVLLRFSYSYDEIEWNYINNAISINNSAINSLMGKYYDVSGIVDNLKVLTNIELKEPKIYWKCETFFRSFNTLIDNNYAAELKIELSEK